MGLASVNDFQERLAKATTNIASGQTVSAAVDLYGCALTGIMLPAAFTGTTLTFQVSVDGTNFAQLINSTGSAVSATVAQGKFLGLDPTLFAGARWLKVVSGSAEGADRVLTLVARPL